jgi:hypothetical protein
MAEDAVIKIQELISYVNKRKKPWAVAVFDRKTKKRAVGASLSAVLEDFGEHSDDLLVIDYAEWKNHQDDTLSL